VNISEIKLEVEYFTGDPDVTCLKSLSKTETSVNENITVTLSVKNIGSNIADNPKYDDSPLPDGIVLVSGDLTDRFSDLDPEEEDEITYVIKATKPGNYVFKATTLNYEDKSDHPYTASFNSVSLKVTGGQLAVDGELDKNYYELNDKVPISATITENVSNFEVTDAIVTCTISNTTTGTDYSPFYLVYDATAGKYVGTFNQTGDLGTYTVDINAKKQAYDEGNSNLEFSLSSTNTLSLSKSNITLDSESGSTDSFTISSNVTWTVDGSVTWLNVSPTSGSNNATVTVEAISANTSSSDRSATFTVSGEGLSETLTVTQTGQQANDYLDVNTSSLTLGSESGSTNSFIISSNVSWTVDESAAWLSVSPTSGTNNGTVTVEAISANTSSSNRNTTVTVSGEGITRILSVTQQENETNISCTNSVSVSHSTKTIEEINSIIEADGLTGNFSRNFVYKITVNAGGGYATHSDLVTCLDGATPLEGYVRGTSDASEIHRTKIGIIGIDTLKFNDMGWVNAGGYIENEQLYMALDSKWGSNIDTYIEFWFSTDVKINNLGYGFIDEYTDDFGYINIEGYEIGTTENTIYYLSDQTGSYNLWMGNYTPTGIENTEQLTFYQDHFISEFAISKTTKSIAFVLCPKDGHRGDIYIADLYLNNPQLIPNQPDEKVANGLSFSPDGNSIAFTLGASASTSNDLIVAVINTDGTNYEEIVLANQPRGTNTHKNSLYWGEDGLLIGDTKQWSSYSTMFEIYKYDFQSFTNLTNTSSVGENNPKVSPDGEKIAYQLRQTGSPNKYGIGVMSSNGLNQTNIIPLTTGVGYIPGDWINNNTILYESSIEGTYDIWQMNADGTNKIRITDINNSHQRKPKVYVSENQIIGHLSVSEVTISQNDQNQCFNATQTITVAGDGTNVIVESGASSELIAGQSIRFLPGFHAQEGSYVRGHITTTETYCVEAALAIVAEKTASEKQAVVVDAELTELPEREMVVYPNPNNGEFTVDFHNFEGEIQVMLFNSIGQMVQNEITTEKQIRMSVPNLKSGMYFIKAVNKNKQFNRKIVIQ
jgi:hypothetical protein